MPTPLVKIFTKNAEYQQIEALRRSRLKRRQAGEFFVEGVRPINQAVEHGWQINALLFSREARLSDWAEGMLAHAGAKRLVELPAALMQELSLKEDPSELIALVAMPADDLARIPQRQNSLVVLLDRPMLPGNVGSVLRSCDALRADGLLISGHAADLYDPETIRASTGSFFAVPAVRLGSPKELLPWIARQKARQGGLQIVGTSEDADHAIAAYDFTRPTLLLAGNETHGLSEAYRALCDDMVKIPMYGSASSLNLACATSIVLYEISRQRG